MDEAIVPGIWPLEVANVLVVAERHGKLTSADSGRFLSLVEALPIVVEQDTVQRALTDILTIARDSELSSYDACYLELAKRKGVELATADARLADAASAAGVTVA